MDLRLLYTRSLALLVACSIAAGALQAQDTVRTPGIRLEVRADSAPPRTLTATDLAALPRREVRASEHGRAGTFAGVLLADVLRRAGVAIDSVRGRRAADYVLVEAADGYRAVFSLAELAPDLGGREVFLVDRRDGRPLGAAEGPLRLVVPADRRPTRWVRQVTALAVRRAAP